MDQQKFRIKTPSPETMISGLRSIGYNFSTAVADIIDNSITALANDIRIFYNEIGPDPYFEVIDNGYGMTLIELDAAMDFGTEKERDFSDSTNLGRFGLGLKTASLSQCRDLTVASKKNGQIFALKWDIDLILSTHVWALQDLSNEEIRQIPNIENLDKVSSGTIVLWKKFDRLHNASKNFESSFLKTVEMAYQHCSLVFHRFYNKNQIYFNNRRLLKRDPFLDGFPNCVSRPSSPIILNDSVIKVTAYRMPAISDLTDEEKDLLGGSDTLRSNEGFYIYRNNRLIVDGSWLKMEHKNLFTHLARIKVDFPATLDNEWSLDVKKSTAIIPDSIKLKLWAPINDSIAQSANRIRYRGEKESDDGICHVWERVILPDHKVKYEINRDYPLYDKIVDSLPPEQKKMVLDYLHDIETFVPASNMRDDVSDDLSVLNGKEVIDQVSLKGELFSLLDTISVDDDVFLHFLPELLKTEKFSPLSSLQEEIIEDYKKHGPR